MAWAYDDRSYSWWNVVPGLRGVLRFLHPPEAIHTPDDLANAPQTFKVCEVRNGKVLFPEREGAGDADGKIIKEHISFPFTPGTPEPPAVR